MQKGSLLRLARFLGRNAASAGLATAVDFGVVASLVGLHLMTPPWATATGCCVGALVNFHLNKHWTFGSRDAALPQLGRYAVVSALGAVISSSSVAGLLWLTGWDYRVVWSITRLGVSWGWHLPLQRFFVFRRSDRNVSYGMP